MAFIVLRKIEIVLLSFPVKVYIECWFGQNEGWLIYIALLLRIGAH